MKDETARMERNDFTVEAMRVLLQGEPTPEVAPKPLSSDERRELMALRRENRRLKMHHGELVRSPRSRRRMETRMSKNQTMPKSVPELLQALAEVDERLRNLIVECELATAKLQRREAARSASEAGGPPRVVSRQVSPHRIRREPPTDLASRHCDVPLDESVVAALDLNG